MGANIAAADGFAVSGPNSPDATAALYGLSMLHTMFNTINTLILIWFTKLIEKTVVWLINISQNLEKSFVSR